MSQDGKERRRRVRAAALVELGDELDMLTDRMRRLPSTDPETFARADAICKVLRRGVEDLKEGSLWPLSAAPGSKSDI